MSSVPIVDEYGNASSLNINSDTGELKVSTAREKIESRNQRFYPCNAGNTAIPLGQYDKAIFDLGTEFKDNGGLSPSKFQYWPTSLGDNLYIDVASIDPNATHFSVAINIGRNITGNAFPSANPFIIGINKLPEGAALDKVGTLPNKFTDDFYNLGCIINEAFVEVQYEVGNGLNGASILTAVADNSSPSAENPSGLDNDATGSIAPSGPRIWKLSTSLIPINYSHYVVGMINTGTRAFRGRCIFSVVS